MDSSRKTIHAQNDNISTLVKDYYNEFAEKYKSEILVDDDPSTWASNPARREEIKERIHTQKEIFEKYFTITGGKVLDLGCGFGRQALILAKMGFQVTAIDLSEVFIDIAKALAGRERLSINFIQMDAKNLIFPEHSFHYVVILDVIEHLPKVQRGLVINKAGKLLVEGGLMVMSITQTPRLLSYSGIMRITKLYYKRPMLFLRQGAIFLIRRVQSLMRKGSLERGGITTEHPFPLPTTEEITEYLAPDLQIIERRTTSFTSFFIASKKT